MAALLCNEDVGVVVHASLDSGVLSLQQYHECDDIIIVDANGVR